MRVAVCQMNSGTPDAEANIARAVSLLDEAAESGAALATLPELFTFYGSATEMAALAQPVSGPIIGRIAAVARDRGMWVLAGSIAERDGDHVYNTSVLLDRTGEVVATYRKLHLFDVSLPGQPPMRESALFTPGEQLVSHEIDGIRFGMSVCYDLRFPELFRGLALAGAEAMLVPAAFTAHTGEAHWEVLLRARAIEDQCFVVAPAQWGTWGDPDEGRRCYGRSMIIDPWGRILAEGPNEGDAVLTADLDIEELRRVRQTLPALQHRRLGMIC